MKCVTPSPPRRRTFARRPLSLGWAAGLALCCFSQWFGPDAWAQSARTPLSLNQNSFLYNPTSVYTSNTVPGVNWQSYRGVPISSVTNSPRGSDGRAPTSDQVQAYPPSLRGAWPPTTNQFSGFMSLAAVPVGNYINLNSNLSFAANATNLNWPRAVANNSVACILRSAQVGAPYLIQQIAYPFGSVIPVPVTDEGGTTLTNGLNLTYWNPIPYLPAGATNSSYYYSSNGQAVFATQTGQGSIIWQKATPQSAQPTNLPPFVGFMQSLNGNYYLLFTNAFLVSGMTVKTPQSMYWTEGRYAATGTPISVPPASVSVVNIIFNKNFPQYVYPGDTTGIITNNNTLWFDQQLYLIKADNAEGLVFVELLGGLDTDGTRRFLGFEIVSVHAEPVPTDINVELGAQIHAYADGRDDSTLTVAPVSGTTAFYYRQPIPNSTSFKLYATRRTFNPNDFQATWLISGVAGLRWPYLFNRYHEYWPSDPGKYVNYVRPLATTAAQAALTSVQLPASEAPSIAYQDDPSNPRAFLSSSGVFYTFLDQAYPAHRTLIQFLSGNNVAYERVFSWLDSGLKANSQFAASVATNLNYWDTNGLTFHFPNNTIVPYVYTNTVHVGDRIVAPPGEIGSAKGTPYLAGSIIQTNGTGNSYNPGAYLDPFAVGFDTANLGAIIPVNAIPGHNTLEVLWFRQDEANTALGFQSSYWPSVIGHYNIIWPATTGPEIILANNAGSGSLPSLQARGGIYRQPVPNLPGYNPNEEHALMIAGQLYALCDDLNNTNAGGYSSDPFVLLNYTGADGRPAMQVFHVRREAPEKGMLFDYVVNAGSILQAPMPLPLVDLPVEGMGASATNYNQPAFGTSADLPAFWTNSLANSPISHYANFTFQDRQHNYWVYRGLNQGLPPLVVGAYNPTNNSFDPLPPATAVVNSSFSYYLHTSRQTDSLTLTATNFPSWLSYGLSTNGLGFLLTGIPTSTGSNTYTIVTADLDGATWTNTLSINIVTNGSNLALGPLAIASTNQYSAANVTIVGRPPFLSQSPTPTNSFLMTFYYKNQANFDWPAPANPPPVGAIVPYLLPKDASGNVVGDPTNKTTASLKIVYRPVWPTQVNGQPIPTLYSGDTLTLAKAGGAGYLSAVRDQSSVQVLYQQSIATNPIDPSAINAYQSVALYDPTVQKTSSLPGQGLAGLPGSVISSYYLGKYYFPNLPPNLKNRVYFDPNTTNLVFMGKFNDDIVGDKYLFLNVLAGNDLIDLEHLCYSNDLAYASWVAVVTNLSVPLYTFGEATNSPGSYVVNTNNTVVYSSGELVQVTDSDQQVDSFAMSATGPGQGYITYIVGDSINPDHLSEPVLMYIATVATPLAQGQLKVVNDPNPLSQLISFQHTLDLAGKSANYLYDWRIAPPVDGQPPEADPTNWTVLASGMDITHYTLGGTPGIETLGDNYIALRYREIDAAADPANTNWSQWTRPVLAEGFIKRALAGINPFNQRTTDLFGNAVNTTGNIISQAGHRWEGDVALNSSTLNNAGLIEIYETLLHGGEGLTINASPGINYGPANDALLLVSGYLNDLYSLVASDAVADEENPTISVGTENTTYGNIATSLFAFQGQEPSLLEEELALLRGRDDSLSPGVQLAPVYNRLYWNYTRGIAAGEVIYALNYNILDQNNDGVVNAADAAFLSPMGHGDAYGHYLSALANYYSLIMNPNFDWVPRIETVNILGAAVSVDYQDERKFAATASGLARTGLQVFDLTWRKDYHSGTSEGWDYLDTTRSNAQTHVTGYWGMDHWASRTAQGAYLNWVVGNSILPPVDPNPNHQGIQKVDRTTVPELAELPKTADQLQTDMNNAEAGFTPFDLSQTAIPFDIDPLLVTGPNPQTHFEQVYGRAVTALNNAVVAFDDAQSVTEEMRQQENSLADLQAGVVSQELAYNNQLIELYGSPYPDDIGPGKTYDQDYSGPDLIHYTYVETPDTNTYGGILPDPTISQTFYLDIQQLPVDWSSTMYSDFNFIEQSTASGYTNSSKVVPFVVGPDGFFSKPPGWSSQRSSPGEIQQAISKLVAAKHALRQAVANDVSDKQALDKAMNAFTATIAAEAQRTDLNNANTGFQIADKGLQTAYAIYSHIQAAAVQTLDDVVQAVKDSVPTIIIVGLAGGGDVAAPAKGAAEAAAQIPKEALLFTDNELFTAQQVASLELQAAVSAGTILIANNQLDTDTKNAVLTLGALENALQGDLTTISTQMRAVSDAQAAYQALVAKGNRIQSDRLTYRQHAAALVQGYRTRDAAFRLFQNEELGRYLSLFNIAAKYAYLAAQAYDYETGLLGTDQGQAYLNSIISAQALGVVNNGVPQYTGSSSGDPGLASALASMKADWDVLKGRLGFNNPDGYGTTVSLRTENYRVLSSTNSDSTWRQILQQGLVADLRTDADVKRNCLQIDNGNGLPVPGIVLSFRTTVTDGLNLFGNQLCPGDHNFSSSSFATKIFAAGVCLDGYLGMDNPTMGGGVSPPDPTLDPNGLAATPYVYLIPCGEDSMRSPPLGDASNIRSWNVDDVAIPLPFNISAASFSSTPFYTAANSLSEPLFAVRGNQAFRPVSTLSAFNTSIYGANGALAPSQYTNKRLIGRSVWNSKWKLVIPGRSLLADSNEGLNRFIQSVKDVHLYFVTYSYSGN
jgi:hypothetical protein